MKTAAERDHDRNLRRVVVSSLVGAVIEWYDFFLYGVVAGLIFNHLYFPEFDARVGTMLAFATFAVGFVARPLGGLVFGHFGDKIGRKKVLVLTLMIMGAGTVAIGCIPSYQSIGLWAPVLLILCRVAQGLGLGGEWGGAVLMSFESAPAHKRAFYADPAADRPFARAFAGFGRHRLLLGGAFQRSLPELGLAGGLHHERGPALRGLLHPFLGP